MEFDENYLELSFFWLTDPEVKYLTQTSDVTKKSQRIWFDSLKSNKVYMVKGICVNNIPVGVIGLKHIDFKDKSAEYFGYIGDKKYWGKGIGTEAMRLIEDEAKKRNLCTIYLRVLVENERAVKLYKKLGYKVIEEKESFLYMRKKI